MLKINNYITKILQEEINKNNPKIRLYQKTKSGEVYSYSYVDNEGFVGKRKNDDFEREIADDSYKGITIVIND